MSPDRFDFRQARKQSGSGEMPFLDHLEELRWRIIWSLLALVVFSGLGFWLVIRFDALNILIAPASPYIGDRLNYLSMTEPFMITLKLGILLGILGSFPVIAYQVWAFVSPALHKREKRVIVPALYMGLLLFAGGVALAYFYVLPATAKFLTGFQKGALDPMLTADRYIADVTRILVAFGVVFELPVVVLILSSLGLVTSKFLASKRRFAIAGMTVAASLLTPGDTITVTVFMMLPLMLLYEMSIALARLMERRRARAEQADELAEVTP